MRGRFEGASVPFKCPALPLRLSEPPRRMVAPGQASRLGPCWEPRAGPPSAMGSCEGPPPAAPSRCRSRPALGAGAGAALPRQRRRAPLMPPHSWPPRPAPGHRRRPAIRSTSAATKKRRHGPVSLEGHGAAVTRAAEPRRALAARWRVTVLGRSRDGPQSWLSEMRWCNRGASALRWPRTDRSFRREEGSSHFGST